MQVQEAIVLTFRHRVVRTRRIHHIWKFVKIDTLGFNRVIYSFVRLGFSRCLGFIAILLKLRLVNPIRMRFLRPLQEISTNIMIDIIAIQTK